MAKIPVLEGPQVEPSGQGAPQLQVTQPSGYDALEHAGAEAAVAAEKINKAEMAARASAVADGLADLQNHATNRLDGNPNDVAPGTSPEAAFNGKGVDGGFMGLRGDAAVSASAPTFQDLQKRRQQIANDFSDEQSRQAFLSHSEAYMRQWQGRIESHATQQRQIAEEDSLKNLSDSAVRAAAADPVNDTSAAKSISDVAGAAHAIGRGKDFSDLVARQTQAEVADVRINGLIAQSDTKGARAVLDQNRNVLGEKLAHYDALISKTEQAALAETTASEIVHRSLRPDGTLNDRAAIDALDKVPPELADNVRPILYRRMTEAEQAAKADTARVSQKAFSAFNAVGWAGIGADLKTQLNQRNPELYNKLQLEDEMRWRRAKASKSDAHRMQAELNRDAMNDFKALPVEQQATVDLSPDGEFAQAHPGADIHGMKAIAPVQRAAGDSVAKGQAQPMNQFVGNATASAEAWLQPGRTPKQKQARAAALLDVKSKAVDAWNDWREAHNGKPPSATEAKKLVGGIITQLVPTNDAEAKAAGDALAGQVNNAKPTARDRALELKRQGKSNADIAKTLTSEGY